MFVAARDELEEEVRGVLIKRDVADLVNLCRYRHRLTYADTAIMPMRGAAECRFPGVVPETYETPR